MFKNLRFIYLYGLAFLLLTACVSNTPANSNSPQIAKKSVDNSSTDTYSNLNLGKLAPLVGVWNIQDWQLEKDGTWKELSGASWRFYPIQGETSLEDKWVSNPAAENQAPGYGTHLRVYDPMSKSWQSAWLSSRTRSLELYTGQETDNEVLFVSQPNAKGRLTRTVFSNIQADHFNWRMEWSSDNGESWLMVYKVDATRKQ
jgi:hypothetical protein